MRPDIGAIETAINERRKAFPDERIRLIQTAEEIVARVVVGTASERVSADELVRYFARSRADFKAYTFRDGVLTLQGMTRSDGFAVTPVRVEIAGVRPY